MKNNKFLPSDYLEFSIETYLNGLTKKSNYASGIIIILFLSAILCMSFVKINVFVNGEGKIRNISKFCEINSPVSGIISQILVEDNCTVKKDEPIIIIEIPSAEDNKYMELYLNEMMYILNNFKSLIKLKGDIDSNYFKIPIQYTLPFNKQAMFRIQRVNSEINNKNFTKINRETMPGQFYDENEYINLVKSYDYLSQYLSIQFQNNVNIYNTLYKKLKNYSKIADHEMKSYSVKSPMEGEIENISHLQIGSHVAAGHWITNILHDINFIAEINISSENIKKLCIGNEVWINISEFQDNRSESIKSKIISISDDTVLIEGEYYYKIRCELDKAIPAKQLGNKMFSEREVSIKAKLFISRSILLNYVIDQFK